MFVDLAQNHLGTFGFRSPMVFLGRQRYAGLVALLQEFVASRGTDELYGDLIALVDTGEEAAGFVIDSPRRPVPRGPALREQSGLD